MPIKLHFHGATRTVTGSCYLLETEKARVLFDCGMFQGSKTEKELNYRAFPFDPYKIDALVLTHAHIDHTGVVPKLTKAGYQGPIYATPATRDLCSVMLPDSGYIQETEVRNLNERASRRGKPEVEPIYTAADAQAALAQFEGRDYMTWFEPAPGIKARYWNAGHLLGSTSIEVEVAQDSKAAMRILFSGDIGTNHKLLEPEPEGPADLDYVICESTYGSTDRVDRTAEARRKAFGDELRAAAERRGPLLIPSFAVERTQEVVTDIVALMQSGAVPSAPIFIDSPLASKATAIFSQYAASLRHGDELLKALNSPLVKTTQSVEESKALARFTGFHIIVAASGMCDAGRIRHHLRNHLFRPNTTVLLVGFQAVGSLGRLLQDGATEVRISGEEVQVRAVIRRFEDYSGHADAPELLEWLEKRKPIKRTVFLTHGEEGPQIALANAMAGKIVAADAIVRPRLDEVYDLVSGKLLFDETRPRISPESIARLDWHNDLTQLVLDINDEVKKAADEKARGVIIRRVRRALALEGAGSGTEPRGTDEG
ncbi:MBL fold metallo-hydrolase [soil metagenome]